MTVRPRVVLEPAYVVLDLPEEAGTWELALERRHAALETLMGILMPMSRLLKVIKTPTEVGEDALDVQSERRSRCATRMVTSTTTWRR